MIDTDHRKSRVSSACFYVDGWLIERCIDIVNRQGVVKGGGVTGDVDDYDYETTVRACGLDGGLIEEGGDLEVR